MSSGPACREKGHDHVVYARNHNTSAFNGYHWTPSDYSGVVCLQTGMPWRTKADYVSGLPDITPEQEQAWLNGPALQERP